MEGTLMTLVTSSEVKPYSVLARHGLRQSLFDVHRISAKDFPLISL
jgi:hypothetical protein